MRRSRKELWSSAWNRSSVAGSAALCLASCALAIACSRAPSEYGTLRTATPASLEIVLSTADPGAERWVSVTGRLEEICPTAGCWAHLSDGRFELRVELPAFTLERSLLGRACEVQGTLRDVNGEPVLFASGLRLTD